MKNTAKFAIIGAGSVSFAPATVTDILLNEQFMNLDSVEIYLMDIAQEALDLSHKFCKDVASALGKTPVIKASTNLKEAVEGADFVITAIEKERYHYWSMDFHIPKRYGFRQIYGENGGPGGMFHLLRNLGPMLEIAAAMEDGCPNAWLLNYTNPEAKLIEAITKLTKIKAVGLCHGESMGMHQLSEFLEIPLDDIDAVACGLNHFGWFTSVKRKSTGEDLYPLLKKKEREIDYLAHWDEFALSRILFRTYGLWPYPGANHIGEYMAWSDEFLASQKIQYFFDPVVDKPWETMVPPEFVYSFSSNPTARELFPEKKKFDGDPGFIQSFDIKDRDLRVSGEYGIPIAEAIFFNKPTHIGAVNVVNKGYSKDLPQDMAIELPAMVDGDGIHPKQMVDLPVAVAAMISQQGAIHQLLIEAFAEKSRNKLLQALLLDPCVSNYNNAVALINEMFERQEEILPPLTW